MINRRYINPFSLILAALGLLVLAGAYVAFFADSAQKSFIVKNPLGARLILSWHSLKKSYNIIHLPYWFKSSAIDEYHIAISGSNMIELNENLPFDWEKLTFGELLDDDKHYVNAGFYSPKDNYNSKIKIRYRGLQSNNWNAEKKALRVKFPGDNIFKGMKGLNLIIPKDRSNLAEALNMYRADKFGLFHPEFRFVRVYINGRDSGVYIAAEPWSQELLAKNNEVDTNNIFSNRDIAAGNSGELFKNWKSYSLSPMVHTF